jgi:hypothetical protein
MSAFILLTGTFFISLLLASLGMLSFLLAFTLALGRAAAKPAPRPGHEFDEKGLF